MHNRENNVSRAENTWKHVGERRNIVFAIKTFLNLLENIFTSWEANFVSATMFPELGKQGNIDKKHNVSATIFPSLPKALRRDEEEIVEDLME